MIYLSGGHSTFFGLLNTFVHIVMYTYYLLAAMGPKIQPYLWWKKYLTAFQMLQFIAIMIHAFQLLFIECNYPKAFVWWIGLHAVMFLFLFKEFYQQSYQQKKPRKLATTNGVTKGDHHQSKGKHANGVTNGTTNGVANDVTNGIVNGSSPRRRDAADYYVKGESLADLNLRKSFARKVEWPSSERISLVDLFSPRRRVFLFLSRNRRRISGPSSLCLFLSSFIRRIV